LKTLVRLFDVVFFTVCAAIGVFNIELFGEAHREWLQRNRLFLNESSVHDTISRIISRIQPEQFQDAFIRWMKATFKRTNGELIAIDGKTLRSSYDRDIRQSTIHMVSAFAAHNRLVLGAKLLAILDVKGCLVSIDAMSCQTTIASNIIKGGDDYLLAVKGHVASCCASGSGQVNKEADERGNAQSQPRNNLIIMLLPKLAQQIDITLTHTFGNHSA
jgi:predicted transposase YbfD/YdcC